MQIEKHTEMDANTGDVTVTVIVVDRCGEAYVDTVVITRADQARGPHYADFVERGLWSRVGQFLFEHFRSPITGGLACPDNVIDRLVDNQTHEAT